MPHSDHFIPQGRDLVPIVQEAGWAPGQVSMVAEILPPPEFDPWTVQLVASHNTDFTLLAHFCNSPNTIRMYK